MNVLAVFAHPDDETMLAGGTLALLRKTGAQVHYISATRGEGGEVGEPPYCLQEELGDVREQEMVCAVQALGGSSLTFLGYTDPSIGEGDTLFSFTDNLTLLAGQIDASIRQFKIDAVITHGSNGEYGHPAHVTTHQAVLAAVQAYAVTDLEKPIPVMYSVAAIFPYHPRPRLANADDPADLVVDISQVLPAKEKAALCHRTQHALFVRRASQDAGRPMTVPEVLVSLESLRRVFPPLEAGEVDAVFQRLSPWRHSVKA